MGTTGQKGTTDRNLTDSRLGDPANNPETKVEQKQMRVGM
jgi:hypothetical protein